MKFVVFQQKTFYGGSWRWRLIGGNGSDIIAESGEAYVNKDHCYKMIWTVMAVTAVTPIVEL